MSKTNRADKINYRYTGQHASWEYFKYSFDIVFDLECKIHWLISTYGKENTLKAVMLYLLEALSIMDGASRDKMLSMFMTELRQRIIIQEELENEN